MLIIQPHIFNNFPQIIAGFSTKIGLQRQKPYFFNMSFSVGDVNENVTENRELFLRKIGLEPNKICYQKQVHSDGISYVKDYGYCGESDALITDKFNLGLVISSADCPAILIYDKEKKVIAAVHSGWRSTAKKILSKVLTRLKNDFVCDANNLICYISPSISQQNYEVGKEVAEKFDEKFISVHNDRYFLDLRNSNSQMLINAGVKRCNIQMSKLCTFEYSNLLHSYRREGVNSGRAIGVLAMRQNN